jgi:hypothetical protein
MLMAVFGVDYLGFLHWIPGISSSLLERVGPAIAANGLPYNPLFIFGGIPLKVYVALAFSFGATLGPVLLWTIFARIVRITPSYAIVGTLRLLFHRPIDLHPRAWLAIHLIFWLAFYVFYFIRMSR